MQQTPFQVVPKEIQMEFYNVSKQNLQFLYSKFDNDVDVLDYLLRKMKAVHVEALVEVFKNNNSEHDERIIKIIYEGRFKLLKHYLQGKVEAKDLYLEEDKQSDKKQELKQVEQVSRIFKFSHYYIVAILDFLDPFTLLQFACTCREFNELIKVSDNIDPIYKKFCKALLGIKGTEIPLISPYQRIVHYLNQNPFLLPPNVINQANDDIRKLIWEDVPEYERIITQEGTLKHFGKHFKNFRSCYYGASRLNYCGLYAVKEKYLKFGQNRAKILKNIFYNREADMSTTYAPCHIVEYYRYARFWRDGQVTMLINVKKLTRNEILHYFSSVAIQDPKIIRGEFIVDIDKVYVKTFVKNTIFTFNYQIKSSYRYMHTIGDSYVTDLNKNAGTKFMLYKHMREFRKDLKEENESMMWKWITY